MNAFTRLLPAIALFSIAAFPLVAGDRTTFFGAFDSKSFDDAHVMNWSFGKTQDGTKVIAVAVREATKVKTKVMKSLGEGRATNVKVQGDKLEFELEWSKKHKVKGPADAKYVAEYKGNDLLIKWTAGNEKGELLAINRNPPVVAKKDPKKDDKKIEPKDQKKDDTKTGTGTGEKVYLSGLITDKGIPALKGNTVKQLGLVIIMGKTSKPQYVDVNKDTKFVVVDGEDKQTYDQKSVVNDPQVHAAFKERYVTLERKGNMALTVTATAAKKKGS